MLSNKLLPYNTTGQSMILYINNERRNLKKDAHVKQSVSKSLFQSSKRNYWKSIVVIRKKNYNTVPVIDNTRGDVAIAELFKDKYATLYISVSSSSNSLKALHERIHGKISSA